MMFDAPGKGRPGLACGPGSYLAARNALIESAMP